MRGKLMGALLIAGLGVSAFTMAPEVSTEEAPVVPALSADEQAVYDAVLDYVEGIYDVQPERIERSVHPEMRKIGYMAGAQGWRDTPMTYQQLVQLAGSYNTNGRIGADAPKEITVFDVLDKTASAKLVADWGVDYFHLVELDGQWKIMNVIWQTPPSM